MPSSLTSVEQPACCLFDTETKETSSLVARLELWYERLPPRRAWELLNTSQTVLCYFYGHVQKLRSTETLPILRDQRAPTLRKHVPLMASLLGVRGVIVLL